jgi:hypothetical protein
MFRFSCVVCSKWVYIGKIISARFSVRPSVSYAKNVKELMKFISAVYNQSYRANLIFTLTLQTRKLDLWWLGRRSNRLRYPIFKSNVRIFLFLRCSEWIWSLSNFLPNSLLWNKYGPSPKLTSQFHLESSLRILEALSLRLLRAFKARCLDTGVFITRQSNAEKFTWLTRLKRSLKASWASSARIRCPCDLVHQ